MAGRSQWLPQKMEEITVEVEGADEDAAAAGMEKFFEETL